MKYVIRIIQAFVLLCGVAFLGVLLLGDLEEDVKPVVLGAVSVSLIISGVLGIIDRKIRK